MYKVLIVDDEPWVLEGIKRIFSWEQEGFSVIAQTTRSVEALELIKEKKPDVVFTDIRMPKISGIELMQKVKELGISTEFIVISGYSEFTYAQEALRLGAFDYCLKPIEKEYTIDLLKKLHVHLEKKARSVNYKIIEFLNNNSEDLASILIESGLGTSAEKYQAVVIQLKDTQKSIDFHMDKYVSENQLKVILGPNKYLFFFNTDKDITDYLSIYGLSEICIGISETSNSLKEIVALYHQADIASTGYFIRQSDYIFNYRKKDIVTVNQVIEKFGELIKNNNIYELKLLLQSLPQMYLSSMLGMEDVVYFWNKVVAIITTYCENEDLCSIFEFMDYNKLTAEFANFHELCDSVISDIDCVLSKENYNKIVLESMNVDFQKMLDYIKEHYSEQLYLKELSKMFFINLTYCCNLFKKYTGGTFSDYVNNLRIEKSKELLKSIDLTIEEVSQQSGYNDYYYFNKLFKKYNGVTPSKYRKEFFSLKN